MLTTPKEFIKWLQEYKNQNQPISIILDDSVALKEYIVTEFDDVFKSKDDVPDELVKKCFLNLGNDDRVHEAMTDSYDYDVKDYIDKYMQEHDDNELWDK